MRRTARSETARRVDRTTRERTASLRFFQHRPALTRRPAMAPLRTLLLALLVLWPLGVGAALGCGHRPLRARLRALPSRPRCALVTPDALRCEAYDGRALQLAHGSPVRAAVGRLGGGAFVLGRDGALARFNARGERTDLSDTPYDALVGVGGYVCARASNGAVWCARDHSEDRACPEAEPPRWFRLPLHSEGALAAREQAETRCVFDPAAPRRCPPVQAPCGSLCVGRPRCGGLHCIDACADDAPIFFHPSRPL
jgi:hypothetical protein